MLNIILQEYLMTHQGEEFNQRQLAIALKVSAPAIMKALKQTKHVKIRRAYNQKLISYERTDAAQWEKRAFNLKLLATSGFLQFIKDELPGITVILFGSYARGEDTKESDIDLALIGYKKTINVKKFERILNRNIHISHYDDLRNIHDELKRNILNGITLHGHV